MGKKLFSLCMALALCLGLLPVTALAADNDKPNNLYVGTTNIAITPYDDNAAYWTSDDGITWTSQTEKPTADSYIHYDGNGTLTLHNVSIQGDYTDYTLGYGIYAMSSSGPVSLSIVLEEKNNVSGVYGINVSSDGGYASLNISGPGSLTVSSPNYNGIGIFMSSKTSDANLTIGGASVTASGNQSGGSGVRLITSQTGSPNLTIAVKGGSLQASGASNGIHFLSNANDATAVANLQVSGNAMVKASSISTTKDGTGQAPELTTGAGTSNTGGIVFDDKNGTVYGNVTLDESLTINQGETLTVPEGSSLNCNDKLTNSGTILARGGTVTGSLSGGTKVTTPSITAQPTGKTVTEGQSATFTVEASAGSETPTYQWQQKATVTESEWEDITNAINASYTTAPTTTDMSGYQYRCVVKSASGVSVISQAATLTVQAKPTYTVTVNASPTEGGSVKVNGSGTSATVTANSDVTLTATANEGYRFTGWMENDRQVSTHATYTFKATGDRTLTAKFEKKVTGVTLNTETLELFTGGSATLTATVQPDDATNKNVTWQSDNANVATVLNGTVNAVGAGEATITVTTEDGGKTATCAVTVEKPYTPPPYIPPTKTPSEQAIDKIEDAKEGSTVKITLRTGQTKLDKEVFEELAGRDVTLEISLSGGVTWTVNGEDIPKTSDLTDLDMGVSLNTSTIPVDLINAITGEIGTVQLTLKHDGPFGFTMTLTAPVGKENEGLWANLYHYDEDAGEMVYQTAALVDEDGNAALPFDHASQYALVLDSKSHDLPFTDLAADAWYTDAVAYVYRHDIMEGMSATTFQPNGTLSRAMAVQIFYNLEGQPDISGENLGYPYEDVNAQAWYGKAVYWARITGVATGYGDGTFQPTDSITRQEFAQMLYNYAKYKGYDLTAGGDLSQFPDSNTVADWAEIAMEWANGNKLINGHDDGTIDAGGAAIRAQAASILMRFDQNLVEK